MVTRSTGKTKPVTLQTNIDKMLMAVEAEEYRRSLSQFVQAAWKYVDPAIYIHGWHIDAICEHLEAVSNGEITRLLINMPPRHMKSTIVSVMWPMWDWITHPERKWMFSSYALSLAIRDSLKSRRLIESPWYQERWGHIFQLASDQNAKSRFENSCAGYRLSASVGSSATGEGADIIICDDPHNVIEAESEVVRGSTLDWWDTTMSTRLNDPKTGAKVIVMQRVHSEDLSGHVLEQGGYEHLRLSAEFEPESKCHTSIWEDPRTHEGELLWPDRIDAKSLNEQKHILGAIGFAGQYQQRPFPAGGSKFKAQWFRYFSETNEAYLLETSQGVTSILKSSCWKFGTSDLAISSKQTADFTVFAAWAVTPTNDLLLLHVFRDRIDNAEQLRQLHTLHMRFMPDFWKIETVAYQLSFMQQALRWGIPCREFKPVRDKESRATTASVWSENGKTYWLKNASFLPGIESELLAFPKGAHDDFVDNYSMAADEVCIPMMAMSDYEMPAPSSGGFMPIIPVYQSETSRNLDEELAAIERELVALEISSNRRESMTENQIGAIDFLVDTGNPESLDDTLQGLPNMNARVVGRGVPGGIAQVEGHYVVRVFGDPGWFKFAVEQQGYCKIIRQLDQLV